MHVKQLFDVFLLYIALSAENQLCLTWTRIFGDDFFGRYVKFAGSRKSIEKLRRYKGQPTEWGIHFVQLCSHSWVYSEMPTSLLRLHMAARSEINFLVRVPTRCFFMTEGYKRSRPSCPKKCFNKLVLVMSGKNGKLSCIQNKLGNVSVISKHPAKPPGAFGTSGTFGAGGASGAWVQFETPRCEDKTWRGRKCEKTW